MPGQTAGHLLVPVGGPGPMAGLVFRLWSGLSAESLGFRDASDEMSLAATSAAGAANISATSTLDLAPDYPV